MDRKDYLQSGQRYLDNISEEMKEDLNSQKDSSYLWIEVFNTISTARLIGIYLHI